MLLPLEMRPPFYIVVVPAVVGLELLNIPNYWVFRFCVDDMGLYLFRQVYASGVWEGNAKLCWLLYSDGNREAMYLPVKLLLLAGKLFCLRSVSY